MKTAPVTLITALLSWGTLSAATLAGNGEATFGVVRDGATSAITKSGAWRWKDGAWERDDALSAGLEAASADGRQLRDFDHDGSCELLANHDIFVWNEKSLRWQPASYALPPDCAVLDAQKRDNGLRFADLNGNGFDDVIPSNEAGYAIYFWAGTVKVNQTPSLPDADPRSDRPRCGGRESKFLAASNGAAVVRPVKQPLIPSLTL